MSWCCLSLRRSVKISLMRCRKGDMGKKTCFHSFKSDVGESPVRAIQSRCVCQHIIYIYIPCVYQQVLVNCVFDKGMAP